MTNNENPMDKGNNPSNDLDNNQDQNSQVDSKAVNNSESPSDQQDNAMESDKENKATDYDTSDLIKYLESNDFTKAQQEIVITIINQLVPHLASEMVDHFKQDNHLKRLEQHFGDPKRWQVIRSQLKKWGKANLDPKTYNALASSFDGILSMHKLMTGESENNTIKTGNSEDSILSEDQLLQMMKDPKYWKTKDPQFIAKVKAGFQKIYD